MKRDPRPVRSCWKSCGGYQPLLLRREADDVRRAHRGGCRPSLLLGRRGPICAFHQLACPPEQRGRDSQLLTNEQHLGTHREQRHPQARRLLLLCLISEIVPPFRERLHAPDRLVVVRQLRIERFRDGRVRDICGRLGKLRIARSAVLGAGWEDVPSCVGPIPPEVITRS